MPTSTMTSVNGKIAWRRILLGALLLETSLLVVTILIGEVNERAVFAAQLHPRPPTTGTLGPEGVVRMRR